MTTGRDCFLPATSIVDRVRRATGVRISVQRVRNTLKACRFKSRRWYRGTELTVHHNREWHAWANQCMPRTFRTVVSLDESRFTLMFADGSIRVWRRPGESCAKACAMPVDRCDGGSVMVWGGVQYEGKTNLIVIRQTLNTQCCCDDILRPVVMPFMRRNNRVVFQHGNVRPHTARLFHEYFACQQC